MTTDPRDHVLAGLSPQHAVTVAALWWKPLAAAAAAGILVGFGAVQLLQALSRPLLLLVLAITLAATLAPIADRLARHIPRSAAVSIVYLALAGAMTLVMWLVAPSVIQQGSELVDQLPQITSKLQQRFQSLMPGSMQLHEAVAAMTDGIGAQAASFVRSLGSLAFAVLVVVFLSAYLLIAAPQFHHFAVRLAAAGKPRRVSRVLVRMAQAMGGYFRGAAIDGMIIGVITWLTLMVLGRPFAAPLAVMAAFGELVPYLGPLVAAVPAVALALLDSPQQAVIVGLAYLLIQQIESHIVTPLVMHSQTHINPGTVLFGVVAGWALGGIIGAIAAVPLCAAIRVLVLRVLVPRVRCRAMANARATAAARGI